MESLESLDQKMRGKRKGNWKANTRPSEDAMFLRRELIDAIKRTNEKIETYSKKADEKMETFDENMR